jgi:hypothetical protein
MILVHQLWPILLCPILDTEAVFSYIELALQSFLIRVVIASQPPSHNENRSGNPILKLGEGKLNCCMEIVRKNLLPQR